MNSQHAQINFFKNICTEQSVLNAGLNISDIYKYKSGMANSINTHLKIRTPQTQHQSMN